MDDLTQLLVVAVAVHENLKLRVASLGFPGLNVHEVDMVFLHQTTKIFNPLKYLDKLKIFIHQWKKSISQTTYLEEFQCLHKPPHLILKGEDNSRSPFL